MPARSAASSLQPVFQPQITQQVSDRRRPHNPHIPQRQVAHRTTACSNWLVTQQRWLA